VSVIYANLSRNEFTCHGMHLNVSGTEKMAILLGQNIRALMVKHKEGRIIAQVVSRWLPTAVAQVRSRVWSSGICGGQSGAEAGILRVLRFPLPIFRGGRQAYYLLPPPNFGKSLDL
jgi:hypothetical protein